MKNIECYECTEKATHFTEIPGYYLCESCFSKREYFKAEDEHREYEKEMQEMVVEALTVKKKSSYSKHV